MSKFRTNSYSECLLIQTLRNVLFSKFQALVLAYGLPQEKGVASVRGSVGLAGDGLKNRNKNRVVS